MRVINEQPRASNVVRLILTGLALAAVGYALFVGPPALLVTVAAPLATLAVVTSAIYRSARREQTSEERTRETSEDSLGERRGPRRDGTVLPWWVLGCAVGGLIGGLGFVLPFFGELILFGGVLGGVQWLVLRRRLGGTGPWVLVSFFGWPAGQIARIFVEGAFPGVAPAVFEATGSALFGYAVFEPVVWAVFGLSQALVFPSILSSTAR